MHPLAAVLAGLLLGAFSGLVPGIHSNTVASVLATMPIAPDAFAVVVAAVLAAHIVFSFFPAIFLSIPDETVVVSVLPGHRLALEGRGREALAVCASSAMIASGASAVLLPAALAILPAIYPAIEPNMALVLACASLFLLASERQVRKIMLAGFVFALSGALGLASMRAPINDPLFPAFCGLFAASGILLSFASAQPLPSQKSQKTKLDFLPYVAAGVLFGMLSDLLPGIAAPAQIAVFASLLLPTEEPRKFLALVAAIAASHAVFAFGALVSIGKAREGALAIMNEIKPVLAPDLPVLIGAFLLSLGISVFLLMRLAKHANRLQSLDMRVLNFGILSYLTCAVAIVSGAGGLLLFATSTAVGLLPPLLGIRRTHVMGLIIVPAIALSLAG
ncbi:MAG: tripartite tricarboxylate transporter permease [Candidatus Micrarchaeota archaeon]|nr:tripartite tricarboxylate transporter permease [Candidatus Micrarchaeota archaeon]